MDYLRPEPETREDEPTLFNRLRRSVAEIASRVEPTFVNRIRRSVQEIASNVLDYAGYSKRPSQVQDEDERPIKGKVKFDDYEPSIDSSLPVNVPLDIDEEDQEDEDDEDEEGCDTEWMLNFGFMRLLLIVFGRWPLTYRQNSSRKGYTFRFSWGCPGFIFFAFTVIFMLYGLIISGYNVVSVLMKEKVDHTSRSTTHKLEQALLERHTIIVMIMLGSYGVNLITSFFIFVKREDTAIAFTKWTRFLYVSKLSCGGYKTYSYVGKALANYLAVSLLFILMTVKRTSATVIGGPTVISIMFIRHLLPDDYLDENFPGSPLHHTMHVMGLCLYFYVIFTCNTFMYFLLWLVKSLENAFFCWNARTLGRVEAAYEEKEKMSGAAKATPREVEIMTNERTSYSLLYRDHIGLVRVLSWFNNIFAYSLEPYILFQIVKIVYLFYLAALVIGSNGKDPLNNAQRGLYFKRESDYIPVFLLMYENCFMVASILYACSWLEDTTYESYDELRRKTLLKGTRTDNESFFYLSMFQSYVSTTRMAIYAGQFFCIDRYSVLHVLSAIMSNFLVVYQFRPLFDMETVGYDDLRELVGNFIKNFEAPQPDNSS